ncbi:phosphonate ABC transporter, permease protein PhnE [Synechococcus sp. PCC 7336]|uniref:phosphonate ABC transporter, permease protein PhnE n=1 Tax=Synechococcus sp. PCC 7336 TaxID=195250 RepID=UPI000347E64E|nr:phosphonate ABC transporter, permease protein PhnE [Synechococcus sp. PCC 7336]
MQDSFDIQLPSAKLDFSPAARAMLDRERKRITPIKVGFWLMGLVILAIAFQQSEVNPFKLIRNADNMRQYMAAYFPPDWVDWKLYLEDTWVTIAMGIWGTLLAAIAAAPLALLASNNISPVWVVQPVRRLLDAMRAINEIVFALIFVVAVGLGPFAGVLALSVHTAGTLGKLFSEAVEAIESGPVEGIRATGASKVQEIVFGVLPQVMPLWTSFTLYRFESNVRSASVLGIVGAGGIGVSLYQSFGAFQYGKVCAILIVLIAATSTIDFLSSLLRKQLV